MAAKVLVRMVAIAGWAMLASGCTLVPPEPRADSEGHLNANAAPKAPTTIPAPVKRRAFVPLPLPAPAEETFTVVVNEVPVRELLFALARDANVNVDVHPGIEGNVTLNAIDQSLNQILDRISRQLAVRYEMHDETLVIIPDSAFLRTYKIDYVNMSRDSTATIASSTLVAATQDGGAAGNTSESTITNTSNNNFWQTLEDTLNEITELAAETGQSNQPRVIINREGGLVLVRATAAQHELVREYVDRLMANVTRQVLIEATIVEVRLSDDYQAGINWRVFTQQGGLLGAGLTFGTNVAQAFTGSANSADVTGLILDFSNNDKGTVAASIKLLNEFGDIQVLSSPKVMTLNNQPAVLKVVDNEVYFEISVDTTANQATTTTTVDTDARTVSVGLVMNVTPQISDADAVTLNVRPTITRVREFVSDPAVPIALALAGVTLDGVNNEVPVVQVRETETVMRVNSGQLAVIGGLMQDQTSADDESVPGFSELPVVGELFNFRSRSQVKSELVVFLRPTVIRTANIDGDLASFKPFLPGNRLNVERRKVPFTPIETGGQQQ